MSENSKFEDSLNLVSRYFRPGLFTRKSERVVYRYITGKKPIFTIFSSASRKIAAAAVAVALVASASCIIYLKSADNRSVQDEKISTQPVSPGHNEAQKQYVEYSVIDFSDAPLEEVIGEIEDTYGVKITNIPTEEYNLTLHYEGNVTELVAIINELLNINLKIENTRDQQEK